MANKADSRRMYSWWWDSHIPKNSKWLQENLTDMDGKVKQMIKLIEEDADSFARRAEMYYKKRPELMKLVEEFYRAYRALAERYDHATGALRQAQRTMVEAFPNQVPFALGDDSPAGSAADGDPRTPDLTSVRAFFDPDDLPKDALGVSPVKRNGAFTEESDTVPGRKGLKQLNDLFGSGEGGNQSKFAEAKARKGLNFHDADEKEGGLRNSTSFDIKARVPSDSERMGKAELEILTLKNAIAKLEAEKEADLLQYQQSMERLTNLEAEASRAKEDSRGLNDRATKAEAEVQTLKEALAKLEAERESFVLQYQLCLEKLSKLESRFSHAEKDAGELSERARKAETEVEELKQELARLESEKEAIHIQYKQCLDKISDLEGELLIAEENAKRLNDRADKAEIEVETLKQEIIKLNEDKEVSAVQFHECLERISSLEHELACAQEEARRLNSDIDDGVAKLKGAEERCLLLENSNQTMHSELENLAQKMAAQSEELTEKQKELGRLWTCIQEERLRFVEAETAFQTLQHLHSQSQEELRSMAAELQKRAQILEDLEAQNQNMQKEAEQVKEVNKGLNEVNLSSGLTIQNLQNESSSLRETIQKLEAEVELRVDERNALQQEIYCLKEELNDLNKNHVGIVNQVESVGLNLECFGSSVKDLQDENVKLKESCEAEKSEKVALLEKLKIMEKLIAKNSLLENSLSDLNVEIEGVREKVKALEESCQSLLREKSTLVHEKDTLASQLQIATENLEKLTEKNNLLENSLLDANAEVEEFRVKSKKLEDLYLLLETEKLDLVSAKGSLISQLDITQRKLEDVGKTYAELEHNYLSVVKERESAVHEVEVLQDNLDVLKQEHASLVQLSESQRIGMASQICLLEKEIDCRKKKYEEQIDIAVNAQMEIFILQKFMKDLEEKNISLFLECQKLSEASKLSEKLISELENENLEQQGDLKSLYSQIEKMRLGLCLVLKTLQHDVDQQQCEDNAEQDKKLVKSVCKKLQETQEVLSKMLDENQKLGIENTVLVTLLGQLQLEITHLVTTKSSLDHELRTTSELLLDSQSVNEQLTVVNEELRSRMMEGAQEREVLKVELSNLQKKMSDSQQDNHVLQEENMKVLGEKKTLMKSVSELRKEKWNLEEENFAISGETVSQNFLSLLFREVIHENSVRMKELNHNLDNLSQENNDLMEEGKIMEGKLERLNVVEVERLDLLRVVADLKCKIDETEVIRADHENHIAKLSEDYDHQSKELDSVRDANEKLKHLQPKLHEELLEAKRREESLNHELQEGRHEIELLESHATAAVGELQMSTIQETFFKGKVNELIEACQDLNSRNGSKISEIAQLEERVSALEGENGELKAQISECIPAFVSLRDCIASLESRTLPEATIQVESDVAKDTASVHAERCQDTDEESVMVPRGFVELQELEMRIRDIEKAVMEKERLIMEGCSSSNVRMGDGHRLQKRANEMREDGQEVTKDIMLDQISECSSYGISRRVTTEADDQMLEIWETADHDGSIDLTVGKTEKASATAAEKKHKREQPSIESLVEKELGVDKLEISKRFSGSQQEGNGRKILERLDSDAQKLANLQITVEDLMKKVDATEKSKRAKGIEYDNVKEQLGESEEAIMKLFEVNRKLMKNIEDDDSLSSHHDRSILASDEGRKVRRKRIAEQARRGSEKIGRLQLEVQKLQFLLLKLDGENRSSRGKTKITERSTSVLLRDYLYGGGTRTNNNQKRKKAHFCACVQPPTKGD